MSIAIVAFQPSHQPAVHDFNQRLRGTLDEELFFPEDPRMSWLPKGGHPKIYQEGFVAVDEAAVRGGYILKHQPFAIQGEVRDIASYRLPISEGLVNRNYAMLGMQLIRDALNRQPRIFSLGMGAIDRPLPKMQKALGWAQYEVPFYFKVIHGGRFVRQIAALRRTRARRVAMDLMAYSGVASLGSAAWRIFRPSAVKADVTVEPFDRFEAWADELWSRCNTRYSLSAVRDSDILTALYPPQDSRFLRWRLRRGQKTLAWVVCLDTRMTGHKQFGNLRVGTIVDGFADPDDAALAVAAAGRELEKRGVDLIVSNQTHQAWGQGLRSAGFMTGPSNFIFSVSKQLAADLSPFADRVKEAHINRADGDGPIHL